MLTPQLLACTHPISFTKHEPLGLAVTIHKANTPWCIHTYMRTHTHTPCQSQAKQTLLQSILCTSHILQAYAIIPYSQEDNCMEHQHQQARHYPPSFHLSYRGGKLDDEIAFWGISYTV